MEQFQVLWVLINFSMGLESWPAPLLVPAGHAEINLTCKHWLKRWGRV